MAFPCWGMRDNFSLRILFSSVHRFGLPARRGRKISSLIFWAVGKRAINGRVCFWNPAIDARYGESGVLNCNSRLWNSQGLNCTRTEPCLCRPERQREHHVRFFRG